MLTRPTQITTTMTSSHSGPDSPSRRRSEDLFPSGDIVRKILLATAMSQTITLSMQTGMILGKRPISMPIRAGRSFKDIRGATQITS